MARERYLMRRLVDGMAGWATFHQASGPNRHYDEHLFYQHIATLASGRDWRVSQQHRIVGPTRRGAPSTIDFVFYRESSYAGTQPGLAFVEVKYLRGSNPSQDLRELRRDIDKLRSIGSAQIASKQGLSASGKPLRFLLIFAQEAGLDAIRDCATRTHRDVAAMIEQARTGDHKNIYRASMGTYLKTSLEWVVIAIAEQRWPL
ncbi:hypothetical protein GCM10011349_39530 [Novosphingobium indicum]|uniref:TnsA endonuclease N-terminal domain-containing protein n=1 Tax=Novosphingobium indicum TaxID=462949 RepID=A0ABQ2K0D7_9SPHN|nr:hypothetical protein [Novosphingobium indicum]GGN59218.1 hypothetical protein GCM10011349_39530 [Novosphingobium indicum]